MTALQSVVLTLPARLDDRAMAAFEGVFSELLDSAATSFQRDDVGDWQIEALFTFTPDTAMIDQMLAPLYHQESITPVPITVLPVEQRDWLAENRAAFPPLHIGRFWVYGSHVTTPGRGDVTSINPETANMQWRKGSTIFGKPVALFNR